MLAIDIGSIKSEIKKKKKKIQYVRNEKPIILEKIKPGFWRCECLNCGSSIDAKQYNKKQLPKLCNKCKNKGSKCVICDSNIGFYAVYCEHCINLAKRTELFEHRKQGTKIKGKNNPAKKMSVRKRLSESTRKSWENIKIRKKHLKGLTMKKTPKIPVKKDKPIRKQIPGGFKSRFEAKVALYLDRNAIEYEYEPVYKANEKIYKPDFKVKGDIVIEVAGYFRDKENYDRYVNRIENILHLVNHVIIITYAYRAGFFESHFRNEGKVTVLSVPNVGGKKRHPTTTLIKKNICNLDYSHFLSFHSAKCHQFHGHTSWNISVSVRGYVKNMMVIDYGTLKKIVKAIVDLLDHKMAICKDYVFDENDTHFNIEYHSPEYHKMVLPKKEVFLMDNEPTIENIGNLLAYKMLDEMPPHIIELGLHMTEGVNNASIFYVTRDRRHFKSLPEVINFHNALYGGDLSKINYLLNKN